LSGQITDFVKESNPAKTDLVSGSYDMQEVLFRKTMGITAAAHELKTPLSILSGYTRLLLDGSLGELNEQQRGVLNEMESGANRLQRFINDFLAFGALESGKYAPNSSSHDIDHTIAEMVQIWQPRFERTSKELTFHPGFEGKLLRYDELKVQHVLSNLFDNALKFAPTHSTVEITTRPYFWDRRTLSGILDGAAERRRRSQRKDNCVRVDVRDSGPGVPAENHLEIFSEFQRLRTNNHADGVGLGLAIAKRLVDAHGGKIWIESGPGPGSTFSFLLPSS
jgi:signal transduction histidine kinase